MLIYVLKMKTVKKKTKKKNSWTTMKRGKEKYIFDSIKHVQR